MHIGQIIIEKKKTNHKCLEVGRALDEVDRQASSYLLAHVVQSCI